MELWFSDYQTDKVKVSIKVEKQLFGQETDYQKIDVFESKEFGRFLSSNGSIVFSEKDEFVYDEAMTPATVIESMRYCFEYIMSKNPQIKIIVITPLNCRGYSYDFGDDSTCWARGYTGFTNTGTLDEFADTMMAVCDSYGIECIDMTRNSCINKANIVQMLPDGVHPSAECHEMIGIELAKKINFC